MRIGQSGNTPRLRSADYLYILFTCIAGIWQSWCFTYGSDRFLLVILILMGFPFALASYVHAWFLSTTRTVVERPDWMRILILWAGKPLCIVVASLTVFAETRIMVAIGFGIMDLPFYDLRLLVGEGAACLAWAGCLLI
jgi:hypothetical protein